VHSDGYLIVLLPQLVMTSILFPFLCFCFGLVIPVCFNGKAWFGPIINLCPAVRPARNGQCSNKRSDTAHIIGGSNKIDGEDLPLEEEIDSALADPRGVVVSCIPGRLALYIQEFPPGDTFILCYKP
jgi:hypothetical protein